MFKKLIKKSSFFLSLLVILSIPFILQAKNDLSDRLSGYLLLQTEEKGQAWYVNPDTKKRHNLGRPDDAFNLMKQLGTGVSESDYNLFKNKAPERLKGKILLRVEAHGEAYYINPQNLKLHYLGRPMDAFLIMQELSLGISNQDLSKIAVYNNNVQEEEDVKDDNQTDEVTDLNISLEDYIKQEKTPKELVEFLNQHFKVNSDRSLKARDLDDIWQKQMGSQVDFSYLISQIVKDDISISGVMRYDFLDDNENKQSRVINILRNDQKPVFIISEKNNGFKLHQYGSSFPDLMKFEEERLGINIYRYGYFTNTHKDYSEIQSPFTWQNY